MIRGGIKMKRKIVVAMLTVVLMLATLCGCSGDTTMNIEENGSGTLQSVVMIEKEYLTDGNVTLDKDYTWQDVTVGGKAYKKGTRNITFNDVTKIEDMDDAQIAFNSNYFFLKNKTATEAVSSSYDEEMKKLFQQTYTFTFPYEVKKTNGRIQDDKKTVVWKNDELYKNYNCWAIFTESPLDSSIAAPKLTGAKNNGYYRKNVTVKATSGTVIDRFVVNGKMIGTNNCIFVKEGKKIVSCIDVNGKSTKITFVIDKTKPVVKGVVNGKTYTSAKQIKFSDKFGVKSATLNGKKFSSGSKVSKKGTYRLVVTDKAGNQNIVKFKIK